MPTDGREQVATQKDKVGFWLWVLKGIRQAAYLRWLIDTTSLLALGIIATGLGLGCGIGLGLGEHPLYFLLLLFVPAGILSILYASWRDCVR